MKSISFIVCFLVVFLLRAQSVIDNTPKLQNAELNIGESNGSKNTMKETIVPEISTSTKHHSDSMSSPKSELTNSSIIIKDDALNGTATPNIIGIKP